MLYTAPANVPLTYLRVGAAQEDAALRLRLQCLREMEDLPESHPFPMEFLQATRSFFRREDQSTLICLAGDKPVACMTVCWDERIPTPGHPTGKRAHLMNVYTAPEHRRRGIARWLFQMVQQEAEARGVTEITLNATEAGRPLYEQLGFRANDEGMYLDIGRDK